MKRVNIKIVGKAAYLQNQIDPVSLDKSKKATKKDKIYDNNVDGEKKAYKDAEGYFIPSKQIEASIREASKNFKQGKASYKKTILGAVFAEEEKIRVPKYDEIDVQIGKLQGRTSIPIARPKWNKWEASFVLTFDEDRMPEDVLKDIVSEAGATCGIGDYRPKYGRYEVAEWQTL